MTPPTEMQVVPTVPALPDPSSRVAIHREALALLLAAARETFTALYDPSDEDIATAEWADQLQRALRSGHAALHRVPVAVSWSGPQGVANRLTSEAPSVMRRAELHTGPNVVPGRDSVIEVALLAYRCGLADAGQEVAP